MLSGYAMAAVLRTRPSGWLLSSYLVLLVAAFVVLKQYAVLDWLLPAAMRPSGQLLGMPSPRRAGWSTPSASPA